MQVCTGLQPIHGNAEEQMELQFQVKTIGIKYNLNYLEVLIN